MTIRLYSSYHGDTMKYMYHISEIDIEEVSQRRDFGVLEEIQMEMGIPEDSWAYLGEQEDGPGIEGLDWEAVVRRCIQGRIYVEDLQDPDMVGMILA